MTETQLRRELKERGLPLPTMRGNARNQRAEWYLLEDDYMRLVVDRTGIWFMLGWDEDEGEETVACVRPEDVPEVLAAFDAAQVWNRAMHDG